MKYIFFSLVLFIFSCKAQNSNTEKALKECINESVNKNIQENYGKEPFDFYELVLKVENELIANELLKNNSKQDYLNLLESITDIKNSKYKTIYQEQSEIMNKFGFTPFSTESIFNQCPFKVSVKEKEGEGELIYNQGAILNKLMEVGYDNQELLKKLINITDEKDFGKIVYRAPVILLVMINIDQQFNPDLKKLEEYKEGRDFLHKN